MHINYAIKANIDKILNKRSNIIVLIFFKKILILVHVSHQTFSPNYSGIGPFTKTAKKSLVSVGEYVM